MVLEIYFRPGRHVATGSRLQPRITDRIALHFNLLGCTFDDDDAGRIGLWIEVLNLHADFCIIASIKCPCGHKRF